MAIFLTGSTGYIGAHIAAILLREHPDRLNLLVRAKTEQDANERLWHALQLHLDFPELRDALETRNTIYRGDLTDSRFRPGIRRICSPGGNHRVGDPLRRVSQSQI